MKRHCRQFAERSVAFLAHRLDDAQRDAFERHGGNCDSCRADLDSLREVFRHVDHEIAHSDSPLELDRDRLDALRSAAGLNIVEFPARIAAGVRRARNYAMGGAIAAAVLMGVLLGMQIDRVLGSGDIQQIPVASFERSAPASVHPVEVQAAAGAVEEPIRLRLAPQILGSSELIEMASYPPAYGLEIRGEREHMRRILLTQPRFGLDGPRAQDDVPWDYGLILIQ